MKPAAADFTDHGEIWCMDSGTGSRGFQFRITSSEELEWNPINLGGSAMTFPVGTIVPDTWYHVAITYDNGDYTMYWTPMNGGFTEAQVLGTWTSALNNTAVAAELVLGNEGRSNSGLNEAFPGLIDEARISTVARAADEFVFAFADIDSDGLPDTWEQQIIDADAGDAIEDVFDVLKTDDFDGDTLTNQREYDLGTDPTVANNPVSADGDSLPDIWELTYFPNIWIQNDGGNPDEDDFNNLQEYQLGTSPIVFNDPIEVTPDPSVIDASPGSEASNPPEHTIDGDPDTTRWSNQGSSGKSITYDLGGVFLLQSLDIKFYNGSSRSYSFDIDVSSDNSTWTTVLIGASSSGTSSTFENFDITGDPAVRYVRYTGYGNSTNDYNSFWEIAFNTAPAADSDNDGLPDWWENLYFENLAETAGGDHEPDGLTNLQEYQLGTDPTVANDPNDADGDGLPDAWELTYFPSIWSQDASGDPDEDTYTNAQEEELGTSPLIFNDPNDTDQDGLPDAWETENLETLAYGPNDDPDGDGFTNAEERNAGTDPDNVLSVPGDTDGMADEWEMEFFQSLANDATGDPDGDGSNNGAEAGAWTDPNDPQDYPGAPADPTRPTGGMVDLLAQPYRTTIPDTQPEFTWIFHPAVRDESQSAYEIIVSSTALLAGAGTGDVWSSGKVFSGDSVNVPCGVTLTRGSTYFWRVRTWGSASNPSTWSRIQSFRIEPTLPQTGARSIYKASANNGTGYNWAGRYQSAFDTVAVPVSVVDKGAGNFFVDFGKDGFGYFTLRLNGNHLGQTMSVKFSEHAVGNAVVDAGGSTTNPNTTTATVNLQNGDVTYEIRSNDVSGGGINVDGWAGGVVTPFRYVELLNCPATVTADDLRHHVLHVPFDDNAASFSSSNATLDAVWEMCRYSMKATSFACAYIDGDRERLPYEADAYINQLGHYGVDREFTTARYSYEWLLDHSTWPTEWKLHFPLMAWADYMYTGNSEALAANYSKIVSHITQYYGEVRADGILSHSSNNIVDWPSGERDGYSFTAENTVVNAFYYRSWRILADIAGVLGNSADQATFTARADLMETNFNSVFWNGSAYKDGESASHVSAHANFFPLALGIVPPDKQSVVDFLKTKQMPCSVYGSQYLLEALFEGGAEDHAIGLMKNNSTSYDRHWWNMIAKGSTISMEAWGNNYKSNQDWNHAWGAAPANIIPRYVLGLKPVTPGFATAEIKPQLGTGDGINGLTSAAGTIPTIRGPVRISVENGPASFKMNVHTPGNMTARVLVPTKGLATPHLLVDGIVIAAPMADGRLLLENLPPGQHSIWLSDTANPSEALLKENWKEGMFGTAANMPGVSDDDLDLDTDGMTNGQEFIANTDPLDPEDRFFATYSHPGSTFVLTVPAKTGRRYALQRSTTLHHGSWATLVESNVIMTPGDLPLEDPAPPGDRAFYRASAALP
ncbi:MAG: discoidin domain-containing protein [Verrucomicrobiae bacterium]|nr:discoidin domain-containing protein [Verrucomicrobiae bacterium]